MVPRNTEQATAPNPLQPNPYSSDPQRPTPYSSEQHTTPHSPQPDQPPQYPDPVGFQSPPPWAPWYGIGFPDAIKRVFKKYATFSGRAGRGEYWWWALASVVVWAVLNVITSISRLSAPTSATGYTYTTSTPGPLAIAGPILLVVWGLAVVVPTLALTVRRLHEVNLSGLLVLLMLMPFLGGLAVAIMTLLPSNPAGQRFDRPAALAAAYAGAAGGADLVAVRWRTMLPVFLAEDENCSAFSCSAGSSPACSSSRGGGAPVRSASSPAKCPDPALLASRWSHLAGPRCRDLFL
jgi:uncharacterized membrane protein YhaH (DUF805 family)